jgi:hypothetical protein
MDGVCTFASHSAPSQPQRPAGACTTPRATGSHLEVPGLPAGTRPAAGVTAAPRTFRRGTRVARPLKTSQDLESPSRNHSSLCFHSYCPRPELLPRPPTPAPSACLSSESTVEPP